MRISEIAYELYKQNWVDTHTTREMRLDVLREYCSCNEELDLYSFDDWINEVGYGSGSLYVCYGEFCDAEYRDERYMCELLYDERLIQLYKADIQERTKDENPIFHSNNR